VGTALFLRNCRLHGIPGADSLLLRDGLIAAVGAEATLSREASESKADDLDLGGRLVLPAFIDAHIHLLSSAARFVSVDCGPGAVDSIEAIGLAIGRRASALAKGAWVRAAGYDEVSLREGRHPTRRDLDAAAPEHPVRLTHRGGHAVVLNSLALKLAGIDGSTPEPPGSYMERDLETGEPTGLLVEMNEVVERALPPLSPVDLRAAIREVSDRLLAAGVTFVADATHSNGPGEWRLLAGLQDRAELRQGVSMLEGLDHLGSLPVAEGRLSRGPVKVMPKELEHEFQPSVGDMAAILRRIEGAGRRAAVHMVTRAGLDTVLAAFEALGHPAGGHRLEHCGICSPEQARRVAALGLTVVTQPGFLYENGDLMLKRLTAADLPDLYPLRRLLDAGVPVAGSSDAPAAAPQPLEGIRAAVERRSRTGADVGADQAVDIEEAVALFTSGAARVLGVERERGALAPGMVADVVVLNTDVLGDGTSWDDLEVAMTVQAGEVAFSR
jgi:predicted amidohydrolase YtcJ